MPQLNLPMLQHQVRLRLPLVGGRRHRPCHTGGGVSEGGGGRGEGGEKLLSLAVPVDDDPVLAELLLDQYHLRGIGGN